MSDAEQTKKFFLLGTIVLGILIVFGLVWAIAAGPDSGGGSGGPATRFSDGNDPTAGPADAKVVVRMFSDFQCPACRAAEPALKQAMQTYADRVRFVWNDFPLVGIHPNGRPAAIAARCAEEQGKFWEYHDLLFLEQQSWSGAKDPNETFVAYAKRLGLAEEGFSECLDDRRYLSKIQDDEAEGRSNGVSGTPTFFIGDRKFVGSLTVDQWTAELDKALQGS